MIHDIQYLNAPLIYSEWVEADVSDVTKVESR